MTDLLFSPARLGSYTLNNHVVMSPMTRSRATGNLANDLMATYYAQRAEAGLIITEGTSPSPNGLGYARIPGLFSTAHVEGWKKVTAAVHRAGSRIFVQLMHAGRVGHPANLPAGARLLGPSAVAAPGQMWTDAEGMKDTPAPLEMSEVDIEQAIEEYARSAELAIQAGFDGVELHGANGYLIDQFLNAASNLRDDAWGKTVEGRIRFASEVARKVAERIGPERVGMRLSPYGVFNGMTADADHDAVFGQLASRLGELGLLYVHLVDHSSMGAPPVKDEIKRAIRERFRGKLILSGGYDRRRAEHDLVEERGDLVAFGRPFIANPKLVSKLKNDAPLAQPDPATFYTPAEHGYTDYPLDG